MSPSRRTVFSMAKPPSCSEVGHAGDGWRVVRDGQQRTRASTRQRWRCISPARTYHRFVGGVAHTRLEHTGVCPECDNDLAAHEGPVAGFEFEYRVREVAEALAHVGQGMTYTEAARRARKTANVVRQAHDPLWEPPERPLNHGQTVADWVGEFTPVVAAQPAETSWPETLVLDGTTFLYRNTWTGTSRELFTLMAAYGYPAGQARGRLWKVWASPSRDNVAWGDFLALLPGRPVSVVCDDDAAIKRAVRDRWGTGRRGVPVHQCEHHMFVNGKANLDADGIKYGDPVRDLFADALKSRAGWEAFTAAVFADPRAWATEKWVHHWNQLMLAQTARRHRLPQHYANGAIEEPLRTIRAAIDHRKFCFRNRYRMNLLLELMRLSANKDDTVRVYAEDIRNYLVTAGPKRARRYRDVYDTWGKSDEENPRLRVYSLWAESAVEGQWAK